MRGGVSSSSMTRKTAAMNKYLQSCKSEFWQKVFRAEADYLLRHLGDAADVLSVGCGPAIVEGMLCERGLRVTGLDVSTEALACTPDSVRTVAGSAEDMPFPSSSFDAVIYVASLQFVEDYTKALRETARVLRPGGALIAMLLNPESDFFGTKMLDPDSYVRRIRYSDPQPIEKAAAEDFALRSEYWLGVKSEEVFGSREPQEACLYIIRGTLRERAAVRS